MDVDAAKFQGPGRTNPYLSIGWMAETQRSAEGRRMKETAVLDFTEVQRRPIDNDEIRLVGTLAKADIAILCAKAGKYFEK